MTWISAAEPPSLNKTSLEFHLMKCWLRIISFKPKIVFLWRLFSSLSIFTPLSFYLLSCHIWPQSLTFFLPWWKMCHIDGALGLSACARVCYCWGVYVGYLAYIHTDTAWMKIFQRVLQVWGIEKVQKFFPQAVHWWAVHFMCLLFTNTVCVLKTTGPSGTL